MKTPLTTTALSYSFGDGSKRGPHVLEHAVAVATTFTGNGEQSWQEQS